ncbi:hypothetical protein L6452_30477 [Arctium lappa]|uniref:Uncharacterized protein n=1 Tax=Arctium lappa TaxID=4217 RepID=A0ACB8ZIT8_ARCLA|nr:hypothetical protein L6452_30477 [Arctium lappa]
MKVAYRPSRNFSLRDFHHAVNNLPSDGFLPKLNNHVATLVAEVVCFANNTVTCPSSKPLVVPTVVHVSRPKEVESNRVDLPIVTMDQEIMEAINENTSVIICGETWCGKTTQVPKVSVFDSATEISSADLQSICLIQNSVDGSIDRAELICGLWNKLICGLWNMIDRSECGL